MYPLNTILAVLLLSLASNISTAQNLPGIQIKENLVIEYKNEHSSLTQTRASSKENALYSTEKSGPVKYELSKKGRLFTIYQINDKNKWFKWGSYTIAHSYEDQPKGDLRLNFLTKDGSTISCLPNLNEGPLVILDLAGEQLIYYISN